MAVVVSQEQNEVQTFEKWGLDIMAHRQKMQDRKLDEEFQKADAPLLIVFVCAMWLTGFDVKTLSCLYVDKPMKAHTLMQTIGRANRVAEGKTNGLIIDYIGIVKAFRQALADYTANIITIRDILWQEMPESYSEESIIQYRDAVYDYVSQHYSRMALSLH